MTAKCFC